MKSTLQSTHNGLLPAVLGMKVNAKHLGKNSPDKHLCEPCDKKYNIKPVTKWEA